MHGRKHSGIRDKLNKSIIALYYCEIENGVSSVFGNIYLSDESAKYRNVEFGPIEGEQYPVHILSVFFSNVDEDKEKELFVLTKWETKHYDSSGDVYWTYIYDNPSKDNNELKYLEALSRTFYGCDCYSQANGTQDEAKYKNAQSIKTKLKQMGFK